MMFTNFLKLMYAIHAVIDVIECLEEIIKTMVCMKFDGKIHARFRSELRLPCFLSSLLTPQIRGVARAPVEEKLQKKTRPRKIRGNFVAEERIM